MRRLGFAFIALAATGTVLSAQQPAPKNLKVLPKEMTRQEVTRVMRTFTAGLGVRCQHCHVGEGNDLSKFDFASDAKPTKEIARKMLLMVKDVNDKHLAGVVVPPPPAAPDAAAPATPPATPPAAAPAGPKVTCFTCHRGALKPLTAPPPGEGRGGALLRF